MSRTPLSVHDFRTAEEASAAFRVRAKSLLDALRDRLDELAEEESKNPGDWGHAGSLAHVAERLDQCCEFLGARIDPGAP